MKHSGISEFVLELAEKGYKPDLPHGFAWYEVPHTAAYSPESGCLFVASEALPHPPPEYDPFEISSIGVFCGIRELHVLAGERDVIADEEARDE